MTKENEKGLKLLVVILLVIVVILGSYLVYDKLMSKGTNIEETSIKLDDNKDYVYDADYTNLYDNKYTEYTGYGENEKISNIKIPYINISSYDAGVANGELQSLYVERAKNFDQCAIESHDCSYSTSYTTYKYNDILSVVVEYRDPKIYEFKTYNFDIKTGKKITYDEMISRLGYNENTILAEEKKAIKIYMDSVGSKFNVDLTTNCYYTDNLKNCYDIAYKILNDYIANETISYFVDKDGNLNIITIPYTDLAQSSNVHQEIFTVEK